eukprot:g38366.t1
MFWAVNANKPGMAHDRFDSYLLFPLIQSDKLESVYAKLQNVCTSFYTGKNSQFHREDLQSPLGMQSSKNKVGWAKPREMCILIDQAHLKSIGISEEISLRRPLSHSRP